MKTRISHFLDRRNAELLRHSDSIEEKRWRARVRANQKEVSRVANRPAPAAVDDGFNAAIRLLRQAS